MLFDAKELLTSWERNLDGFDFRFLSLVVGMMDEYRNYGNYIGTDFRMFSKCS